MSRISIVKSIKIVDNSHSSVILIGDSLVLKPRANVFAVQRRWEFFDDREGDLRKYPLFSRPLPHPFIWEPLNMKFENKNPYIKVNHVRITGISSSGIFQVGSNLIIDSEARTKHFRQLLPSDRPKTKS